MAATPYTLPKIGWYDFDRGVLPQILSHSYPPSTVTVEDDDAFYLFFSYT